MQCQSGLTLEQPGAQPPAQMCADDPPVQSEEGNSLDATSGAHSLTKIATGRRMLLFTSSLFIFPFTPLSLK